MDKIVNDINTLFLKRSEKKQFTAIDQLPMNRAFLFGDGLFETMIYTSGKIRFKAEHLARMKTGCEILYFEKPDERTLDDLESYLKSNHGSDSPLRIRWNLFRAGSGKYTPESRDNNENFIIQKYSYIRPLSKNAYINRHLNVPLLPWSNCKTLNALVYVMANLERVQKQYDEVILLNSEGFLCEAGAANLFWIKNGVYHTPSLDCNCIAGIGRTKIIETLKKHNLELVQGKFRPEDLVSADQVFTSNVTGIHYISHIDMREYDTSPLPILEQLFQIKE